MRRWINTPLHAEIFKSSHVMNCVGTRVTQKNCITQVVVETFLQLEYCNFLGDSMLSVLVTQCSLDFWHPFIKFTVVLSL